MSANADLQDAVTAVLGMSGRLRATIPVLSRRTLDRAKEIEAATAKQSGLCIFVMPPWKKKVLTADPDIFVQDSIVTVRIAENPQKRPGSEFDGYDIQDDVWTALHWEPKKSLDAAVAARMTSASEDLSTAATWVAAQPQYAPLVALATVLVEHPMHLCADQPQPMDLMVDGKMMRVLDTVFSAHFGFRAD